MDKKKSKLTREELDEIGPKMKPLREIDYSKMRTTKFGELRLDKEIVLTDIIQKLYKELWTPFGMMNYLCDYHNISQKKSQNLINEAKSMYYHHLKELKGDIFLDCYNMMMVVAQKGMETEDYKLVLDTTKEIAKLHQLYSQESKQNENIEQPLFSPPQRFDKIDGDDLYVDYTEEDIDTTDKKEDK